MKQRVIITQGLPASGKSTWAKGWIREHPGWKRINRDELRAMLDEGVWSRDNEEHVKAVQRMLLARFLDAGCSVIVDDTNLSPNVVAALQDFIEQTRAGVEVTVRVFDVPLDECLERNRRREKQVPEDVIVRMWREWKKPAAREPQYRVPVDGLPSAILCDLDGTLALLGDRSPYDETQVGDDKVHGPVLDLLVRLAAEVDDVIFMSGRTTGCEHDTLAWLVRNVVPLLPHVTWQLRMRAAGDQRKDSVIKKELFDAHVEGKFNVWWVLDDRNQVVEMWRSLGLFVLQVAPGDF